MISFSFTLLKNEYFFNGHMKQLCNIISQPKWRVIFSGFNSVDCLSWTFSPSFFCVRFSFSRNSFTRFFKKSPSLYVMLALHCHYSMSYINVKPAWHLLRQGSINFMSERVNNQYSKNCENTNRIICYIIIRREASYGK